MFNFKSKIAIKLLGYYFLNPNSRNYINELAKILEIDPGNLDKKLKELEKEGILRSETSGRQRYYFLNKGYPFIGEVKKIYESRYGLKERLFDVLKNLEGLKEAYIFGSYAQNNLEQESDIDILLIGSHSSLEAKRLILGLQKQLQRELNIVDFTEEEYLKRKKKKDGFLEHIFKGRVIKII